MSNAFLEARALNALPPFSALQPADAEPALDALIDGNRERIRALLAEAGTPSWASLIEPLEALDQRLSQAWGPLSHLFSVRSTAEWRKAFNACLPKITEYGLEISQSEALYRAYLALSEQPEFATLDATRQKLVHDALRDFRLSGIGLPEDKKARFKVISLRLSELQTRFEENVMDAVQAFAKQVTDRTALAGMTEGALAQAAAKAKAKGLDGWLLTLDFPSYDAVVSHADSRALRQELYTAYATRASDQGPQAGQFDNSALIEEILALRYEEAQLLGYANFAELSLATKMADSANDVEAFLVDLARRARPRAREELDELRAYARERDGLEDLQPWDAAYYTEKLKDERLGLADEQLRPYFPLPSVLDGLFGLISRLYGMTVKRVEGIDTWHADVEVYALHDPSGDRVGMFFLDPFSRQDKRGGAWMDECQNRYRSADGLQLPVAYLVCNFRPAGEGQPALLTHDEVLTLFHEFGHGLHLLLTKVDEPPLAGIHGVEWDAVELPSQFMENWCYDGETLRGFARHWQTGEPLPDALLDKLRASRVFQAGMGTVRQIEFALFDLRLHRDYAPGGGARVLETIGRVREEVAVMVPPAFNRMPWSFSHIFAGGYAAGYYSYKWAEVLSADAFAAFEEAGLGAADVERTGRRFRDTVLANGGSRPAGELFAAFRGRDPSIEPLLRHNGLVELAA